MTENSDRDGVLIVEDDEPLAALYEEWLTPEYCVETVTTGEQALDRMSEAPADLVLLDRHLPDTSGDEVLTSLRNRGYDQPVAMITAIQPEFGVLELGFDEYMTKPIAREELHGTVERLLEVRSLAALQRSLSAKKVKRNVLRTEHSESELAANEEYALLLEGIERLERRLDRRKAQAQARIAD